MQTLWDVGILAINYQIEGALPIIIIHKRREFPASGKSHCPAVQWKRSNGGVKKRLGSGESVHATEFSIAAGVA